MSITSARAPYDEAIFAAAPDATELEIPGDDLHGQALPLGQLEVPQKRFVDTFLASIVTFVPPLAFIALVVMHITGWATTMLADLAIYAVMHLLCVIGVELGYHRLFAHGSYKAARLTKVALAAFGSMAFQGPVIWWAAVHRKHHRYSDRPTDPHSIYIPSDGSTKYHEGFFSRARGFIHGHVGWIWTPSSTRFPGWNTYVRNLYRDKDLLRIHLYYLVFLLAGLVLPGIAGLIIHGTWKGALVAFLWGGFARVFLMNHLSYWTINTISHSVGARPYKTADHSTNSIPMLFAIPTLGQSYHNNHHAFPASATMRHRWYELDLGIVILRTLEIFGQVSELHVPTEAARERKKLHRSK